MKGESITMKIGISGTEYDDVPVQELINAADILNVKYLELWYPANVNEKNLDETKHLIEDKNIEVACISTWTQLNIPGNTEETKRIIKKGIDFAVKFGAKFTNTYFGANSERTGEEALVFFAKNIRECIEYAKERGITILMENEFHISGKDPSRRADNVNQLIEMIDSPNFLLTYDPCNFLIAGEEGFPYAYNLLKDYIGYIHIKDVTKYIPHLHGGVEENKLWEDMTGKYICVYQGEGALNSYQLISRIKKDGYDGYIILEPHVPRKRVLEAFKKAKEFIEKIK